MANDPFFEGKDLVEMAKRSPGLVMDSYDDIKDLPNGKEAYGIAAKLQYEIEQGWRR